MAVSETDIVNAALRLIGAKRITSMTDGSKNANVSNDIYVHDRDELLRAHTWRFATKLATLSRLTTAPAFGFDYAYSLPADWLRTITLHNNDAGYGTVDYEEAEVDSVGALLCSIETAYLKYVYVVTDTNRMAASFHKALMTALARDMAVPIANSNTLRELYTEQATRDLTRAKSSDTLGSPLRKRPIGSWVGVRQRSWPS